MYFQEVSKYQELKNVDPVDIDDRPRREYSKVTIERLEVGGKWYMFGTEVFDLTTGTALTEEDLKNLPFQISYIGPEFHYKTDEKEAFSILLHIISNANKLQDDEFYSFPLG